MRAALEASCFLGALPPVDLPVTYESTTDVDIRERRQTYELFAWYEPLLMEVVKMCGMYVDEMKLVKIVGTFFGVECVVT